MHKKSYNLLFWIICFQLIGYMMGYLTKSNINSWYSILEKSALTPPSITFGIVWTILYVMLSIVGWFLFQVNTDKSYPLLKPLYCIQMLMNWLWTPLFFHFHFIQFALVVLILMVFINLAVTYFLYKIKIQLGFCYFLYLIWLFFASYLNLYIYLSN
jgi:translocator protein